jgi:hypothetical protein
MPKSPKKYMYPQDLCTPDWTAFEWKVITWMDKLEKRHYNLVWEKFNNAHTVLTSCNAVFNSLRRICDLAMTPERDREAPTCPRTDYVQIHHELTIRLFELKDWATNMDQFTPDCTNNAVHRLSNISELFGNGHTPLTATCKPPLDWRLEGFNWNAEPYWEGMTEKLQHIFMCQIDFRSMRTGSMESLLQSTNELISAWKSLISSDLNGLYLIADVESQYHSHSPYRLPAQAEI